MQKVNVNSLLVLVMMKMLRWLCLRHDYSCSDRPMLTSFVKVEKSFFNKDAVCGCVTFLRNQLFVPLFVLSRNWSSCMSLTASVEERCSLRSRRSYAFVCLLLREKASVMCACHCAGQSVSVKKEGDHHDTRDRPFLDKDDDFVDANIMVKYDKHEGGRTKL